MLPPLLKGTKKGETTCDFNFFAHFQSQNYVYLHNTCVLTPWQDAAILFSFSDLSWEVVETPGHPPQERGEVSPTSGDMHTTSSSLQKQETFS